MVETSAQKEKITPVRKQYLDIKAQHEGAILFFRLGDFYETFDEDAEIVSKILDIVLTSRNVAKGTRIPMAGIPYHAAENYLSRLIEKGYHVAICDQIGDEPVNGLMPREVVRIVTPGTLVEPSLLPGDSNNYLAAVFVIEDKAGIAYADITTGEFAATQLSGEHILGVVVSELNRLHPAEILVPDNFDLEERSVPGYQTVRPAWQFEPGRSEKAILKHFASSTLDGFGLNNMPLAVSAAAAIIQYLDQAKPDALKLLTGLRSYNLNEFMTLDSNTRRNLELTETLISGKLRGSLLGVIDKTVTPMGSRKIRQWINKPLLDVKNIRSRQEGVTYFFGDGLKRAEVRQALKPLPDLERLINRVASNSALPRDLAAIRSTLVQLPQFQELINAKENSVEALLAEFHPCEEELKFLENAISDDPPATLKNIGVIRPGYSSELDEVMAESKFARDWIANLETQERARLDIRSLKVGYNKVHGYYIEVTKSNVEKVPEEYIRKQTLVNAERYITPEMKEYENQVLNAEENIREIESRLFYEICDQLSHSMEKILTTARILGKLDVFAALAEIASLEGYARPDVIEDDVLEITGGRHPVVEQSLQGGSSFIPNDAIWEEGERIRIITGPNMSGKSTYLRQVAVITLLAQMGSYIPAESAKIGVVDRIFTRIGAQDEIHAGQSTFMVEMVEMANILHHATQRSLLILDEIGRGTSTYDGLSIAWSVIEYLHNQTSLRPKTLFATHYHELTQLPEMLPGVRNYNVAVSDEGGQVVFMHKIVPGGADQSYGIHVGQLAGLPSQVISRAEEILKILEATSGSTVEFNSTAARQIALFPENNPLLEELKKIDIDSLSPMEALNKLFELKRNLDPGDEIDQ